MNDARINFTASISEMTEKQWDEVIRMNSKSRFLCSKIVLFDIKQQRSGVIRDIPSGSGKFYSVGEHCAASKGGMNTFPGHRHLKAHAMGFGLMRYLLARP